MLELNPQQRAVANGTDGAAMALRIVAEAARLMGAPRLIPVASAHIDGALYHWSRAAPASPSARR